MPDGLNRQLEAARSVVSVDVSTASRATIGGWRATIHAADVRCVTARCATILSPSTPCSPMGRKCISDAYQPIFRTSRQTIRARYFPTCWRSANAGPTKSPRAFRVQRRVGGYNLDALAPPGSQSDGKVNLSHLLVGSEGTLAFRRRLSCSSGRYLATRRRRVPFRLFLRGDELRAAYCAVASDRRGTRRPR